MRTTLRATSAGACRSGRRSIAALVLLVGMLVAAWAGPASAQEKLELKLTPAAVLTRSDAPILVAATLHNPGTRLLEGRLVLDLYEGSSLRAHMESEDLVLAQGTVSRRILLPATVHDRLYGFELHVRASFATASGSIDLGRHPLLEPARFERTLLTCLCAPQVGGNPRHLAVALGLSLEGFDPKQRRRQDLEIATAPVRIVPEAMPDNPMDYCAFDMVVLAGRAFGEMRRAKLEALRKWVEGGGGLMVLPEGPIKDYHVEFLQALTGEPEGTFALGGEGGLVIDWGEGAAPLRTYYSQLGRTVVAAECPASEAEIATPPWRRAAAFMLKARGPGGSAIGSVNDWDALAASQQNRWQRQESFGSIPTASRGLLGKLLMPTDVRILPFWVVLLALVLFVIVIGPVDYYLLGLLKARKFTWIFFPAVSVAFAGGMMLLAGSFMGRSDRVSSVTIIDVGSGGRVLRSDRCELHFPARRGVARTRLDDSLFTDMGDVEVVGVRRRMSGTGEPLTLVGTVPTAYTVTQRLEQWRPQLHRVLSLAPEQPDESGLNWDAVSVDALRRGDRGALTQALTGGREFDGLIYLLHLGRSQAVNAPDSSTDRAGALYRQPWSQFVADAGFRPSTGIFRLISQVSPSGSATFEDTAVLDPTDPNAWLLCAVVADGRDYTVYRRLYRGE